jgi:hypothetical protein
MGPAANAQVWIGGGSPYGIYGSGYYPTSYGVYAPAYPGIAGTTYYSSGYAGYAPAAFGAPAYAPVAAYGYPAYGYPYATYSTYRVRPGLFGRRIARGYW